MSSLTGDSVDSVTAGQAIDSVMRDLGGFRGRRRSLPLLPYENLDPTPWQLAAELRTVIERRLANGFQLGIHAIPSITGPIDWSAGDRSFAFHLHAWEPITEILTGCSIFGDDRYLLAAVEFAKRWLEQFQLPAGSIGPVPSALDQAFGPMPWYDMAVGQRVYRLAYLADVMARDARFDEQDVRLAFRGVVFHLELLKREDFVRGHNNHGFFQALGELATCRRFRDEPFFAANYETAEGRVRAAVDQQFHSSGVHREHSPGYHLMVLATLIGARSSGLVDSPEFCERIDACERALAWFIQPSGALVTFGDTDPQNMSKVRISPGAFKNPYLRYHVSGGSVGERPPQQFLELKSEGYAIASSSVPERSSDRWWYLAQIASFQSRTHKHADDLSFVWSDEGTEILIDPGRYGYSGRTKPDSELAAQGFWYSDPKRVYVESTRAHNTIEIDGRSYDRRGKSYGSGLRSAQEMDGLFITECEVRQFRAVRHWRVLTFAPGRFLLVVDWLFDRSGQPHDFRQHVHFHPAWTLVPDAADPTGARVLAIRGESGQRLVVVSLAPEGCSTRLARGQEEPQLLGWMSDRASSLSPCSTLVSEQTDTDYTVFATLFSFAMDAKPGPKQTIRRSMRPSVFRWAQGDEIVSVEISRGSGDEPVAVQLRCEPRTS